MKSTGQVITWPATEMLHYQRTDCMGLSDRDVSAFYIRSSGQLDSYRLDNGQVDLVLEASAKFKPPFQWTELSERVRFEWARRNK